MGERLAFTFALTGRREWVHGTQGVALGYGLVGLSARAGPQTSAKCPHNLHLLIFLIFPPNAPLYSYRFFHHYLKQSFS